MPHRTTAVAAVAALGLLGGRAAAVAADRGADSPAGRFQAALAEELGVSASKLDAASERAAKDTVEQLQRDGKLDADRARKLEQRIDKGAIPFSLGERGGKAGRKGGGAAAKAGRGALAQALGVDRKALAEGLKGVTPPATLIERAGKDRAAVREAVKRAVREALGKGGKVDAAKADARAAKVADRLTGTEPLRRKRNG